MDSLFLCALNGDALFNSYPLEDPVSCIGRTRRGDGYGDGPIGDTDFGDSYPPYLEDGDDWL